jgi:hypothetical protein
MPGSLVLHRSLRNAMGRECGAFGRRLDGGRSLHLLNAHGTELRHCFQHGFRDRAAALVALELGFGGRSRVAMV